MNQVLSTFRRRRTALGVLATIALIAIAALLAAPGSRAADDKAKPAPKPALTVTAVSPQRLSLPLTLTANGNLAAWQEASVGTQTNGQRLAEVRVNVGDRVKRGQVLATFATDTLSAESAQARAALAEAEANASEAAANAERARTLSASGALSASQINQYLTAAQTAKARVEAARAAYQAQQVRLSQAQVRAPDDGIISARNATIGAVLGAGTELFRLIRQGRLEWRAEVTASELGRLQPGTPAQVVAASGAKLEGKVRMIGPTVDPQTRNALVYVDVKPLDGGRPAAGGSEPRAAGSVGAALPGMFASGEFKLGESSALTLAQPAVVVREGFSYVMRLNPDNRVSLVKVQTGRITQGRIEITSGLAPDARVVASGGGFLNDGDLVRVVEGKAP